MMSRSSTPPISGISLPGDAPQLAALAVGLVAACAAFVPWGLVTPTDTAMFCLAVGGVLGFVLTVRALRRTDLSARRPWRITLAMIALGTAALASVILSRQPFTGLLGAPAVSTGLAQLSALSLLALGLSFSATSMRRVLLLVAPYLIGLQLLLAGAAFVAGRQPVGTLSNSSYLGQFVLLLAPLVVGPKVTSASSTTRVLGWVIGAACAGLLALYGSLLAAALLLVLLATLAVAPRMAHVFVGRKGLLIALAGILFLFALPVGAVVATGADSSMGDALSARPYLWGVALDVIAQVPLLGAGPDAFRVAASPFVADGATIAEGWATRSFASLAGNPHNLLLEGLVSVGIVGVLLLLWLIFELGRNWQLQAAGDRPVPNWCAWGVVLYLCSGAMAPLPLQTLVLASVLLGASLRPEFQRPSGDAAPVFSASRVQWTYSMMALVLTLVLLGYSATRLWVGAADSGPPQAQRASRAADVWSRDSFLRFWEGRQWWLAQAGPGAIAASGEATSIEPDNAFLWLDHAHFLALYDPQSPEVMPAFSRAEELYPASLEIPLYRGWYLLEQGDVAAAQADAARALELAPNDPEANELMQAASE